MKFFSATVLFFLATLALFSCASTGARDLRNFYSQNSGAFREARLSNGIPVVLKNIPSAKNIELRLIFEGGASMSPRDKSGMSALTFTLISNGNKDIKNLLSRGLYFPVNIVTNDYSAYGFAAPVANFNEALEAFAASILNPTYTQDEYLKAEAAASASALDRNEDPRFELIAKMADTIFPAHPYYEGIYYKTTSRVSEYDIRTHIPALLNSNRIRIIAAGNFSYKPAAAKKDKRNAEAVFSDTGSQLLRRLDALFGQVQARNFQTPPIPQFNLKNRADVTLPLEFAGNYYYAALCFKSPRRGSRDYEAFALSTLALDFVLRRDVVNNARAATACGTGVLNGKESLVLITATGENERRDIKAILEEALKAFYSEEELASFLNTLKNLYISRILASAQNEYATLEQISSSIFYEGSPSAYLNRIEKIQNLTAADVVRAFRRYFQTDERFFIQIRN